MSSLNSDNFIILNKTLLFIDKLDKYTLHKKCVKFEKNYKSNINL